MKKLNNEELEKVDGGSANGFLSSFSEEEYNRANVVVIGWGYMYNDGYKWRPTGQDISTTKANWAVHFYEAKGRAANDLQEVENYYNERQKEYSGPQQT